MSITPISQNEINQSKVASLPARPNASTAFGGAGYSSAQLKEDFDRLPLLAIGKLNELLSALSKAPGEGSLADEIMTAKTDNEGNPYTLSELFLHIIDGTLATYLLVGDKPLDMAISEITPLQSPAFTGEPTAPTPSAENDSNRIATTAFVYSVLKSALSKGTEQIKTTSGDYLRFFVGTKEEYEALEDKNSLFAIITDDETKDELFRRLLNLENALQALEETFANMEVGAEILDRLQEVENGVGINEGGIYDLGNRLNDMWGGHMDDITTLVQFHDSLISGGTVVAKAEQASHASTADQAGHATEADIATEAHTASMADKAKTTDLTNAQWTAFDRNFVFEVGKSYQIRFKCSHVWAWVQSSFTVHEPENDYERRIPSIVFGPNTYIAPFLTPTGGLTGDITISGASHEFYDECSDFQYRLIR